VIIACPLGFIEDKERGTNGVVGIYDELIIVQTDANLGKNLHKVLSNKGLTEDATHTES
jgi:hypothetical protein